MFDNNRFSNFLVWFETEAFETGWDYWAIAFQLPTFITPHLQEGLWNVAPTKYYAKLKGALMQIDTQYWEAEVECTLYAWPPNKPTNTNTAQWTIPTDKLNTMTPQNATRGPLTQEEQDECWRTGACIACRKMNHLIKKSLLRKVTGRATYTNDREEMIEDFYEVTEEVQDIDNEQESDSAI